MYDQLRNHFYIFTSLQESCEEITWKDVQKNHISKSSYMMYDWSKNPMRDYLKGYEFTCIRIICHNFHLSCMICPTIVCEVI